VIYIIKENRTYDEVLGDMKEGDSEASLVSFPDITITPNHHALASFARLQGMQGRVALRNRWRNTTLQH